MEQQEQPQQLQGQELENGSSSYNPSLQVEVQPQQNLESNLEEIELMSVDQCDDFREVEVAQMVGATEGAVVPDANLAVRKEGDMVDVEVKFVGMGKRKRGRPPRAGPVKPTRQVPPSQRKKRDEEDVCFICFDGGSLVLCDRRGCPKAYHPSCIKRDESFFRSRAKWNCGWHICSSCRKASYYMCYTCTYSLCKGCTKDADYFSIRGNKGLCGTCMRTIMLIENGAVGNQETVQVDFDDKSSWEYLFKVYWMYLKEKLFLTLDDLTRAKNPWNGPAMTSNGPAMTSNGPIMISNGTAVTSSMGESSGEVPDGNSKEGPNSENFSGNVEVNHAKRRKSKKQPLNKMKRSVSDQANPSHQATKWATDDLLDFVAYMKNGDTSVLTQLDVQALVLEYVKRNNLRDGDRQCQIVCDKRLYPLFGCDQVGHFEMLRIIESHFLNRGNSIAHATTAGVIDVGPTQVEVDARNINQLMMDNDKRRKTRKKTDKKGSMQVNPHEYAAIDVHNIHLIYLKRSLAENLIGESEKFHDKVVGSIVRIKITGSDPKQDLYRLVLVTGTSTAAEPYKIGEKTTDLMLEVLNLHKKEVLPIDAISNQEFSEEECRRLRQSIKCGLMKHLTVGEVQEKAMALLSQRVDDSMEAEILRLNNLRDRASEKGHRKELRECVEKLQLLDSPDERKRRLLGIPEVHTDPNMDPNNVSEEDAENFDKPGNCLKPRNPCSGWKGKEPLSPPKIGDALNDIGSRAEKILATTLSKTCFVDQDGITRVHQGVDETPWNQRKESVGLANNQDGPTSSLTGDWNDKAARISESFSGFASGDCLSSNSLGIGQSAISAETDKIWNYEDPTGKIQGPFSMMQLRKWSTSGHFPPDLRVWRTNQKQDDSILLTDALKGRYKGSLILHNNFLLPVEVRATFDGRGKTRDGEWIGSLDSEDKDIKRVKGSLDSMENDGIAHSKTNDGVVKSNEQGSQSSSLITLADDNSSKDRIRSLLPGADLLEADNSWPERPSVCDSLPSPTPSENPCETSHQVKKSQVDEMWKPEQSSLDGSLPRTEDQIHGEHGDEKQFDSEGNSGQSCGQNCRSPPNSSSSNGWDSKSAFIALLKSLEIADQNQEIDFSGLPSSTPKPSHFDLQGRAPEIKQSVSSDAPLRDSGSSWPDQPSMCNSLPSPTPSEKPCETQPVKGSQGTKMWKSEQSIVDGDLPRNSGHQIHIVQGDEKQVDSEAKSSQSSGQNWRTSTIDSSTNGWESNSFGSLGKSLEITVQNREINFSDLPSPSPKLSHLDLQGQAPETKKSVSPGAPLQDSGPSWSTASSPVAGGPQLPDVAGEWGGYSPTPAKPSLEQWESGLMPPSALKPTELPSDHAASPASGSCQFAHSSPSHPASNAATWRPIVVTEPDEFTTLSEESVSDLLAEVEAMESLNGLGSPTSTLRCGVELTQGSDNDCFSPPLGGLSPTLDTGRSASLSSSSDLQIHSQSTVTDEPLGVSQADGHDPQKSSGGRSSTSNEVEDDTKPSDDSVNQYEAASDISPPLPPATHWGMATMESTWRPRSETTNISQGVVQGNGNLGLGGLAQGITNLDWGNGQWTDQDHVSMSFGATVGNLGNWGNQPRHGGGRIFSPRGRDLHGRDSNSGRARPVWSRQGLYDDGNGGGSFRPSPRGQRVCKFYESGYCKKGASCSYLHP